VSFALREISEEGEVDDVTGTGNGYFNAPRNNTLVRLIGRGPLNAPWELRKGSVLYVGTFQISRDRCCNYNTTFCGPLRKSCGELLVTMDRYHMD